MMFAMSAGQFDLVYNASSFTLASMMASTIFFWLRVGSIHEKYKSAMVITGLVTFIAAYHYIRIFNSWVDAYEFPNDSSGNTVDPVLTGKPFNDAYRYMDWLLTVPLLLIEIVFVMNLSASETFSKAVSLGVSSGLMIILGYPGELILSGPELNQRWMWWFLAMLPFLYVVYTLLVGLKGAIAAEANPAVRDMINGACYATVISWMTYPFVYILPMLMGATADANATGASTVVGIQLGYCAADIISKCGVGFLIYNITITKSEALNSSLLGK